PMGSVRGTCVSRRARMPAVRAADLMGGEDLGDIPACLGQRPGAGESTLNRRPRKGDQEATALRSTHNPKICRTKTMIITGSGQDPPYRGKFEHAPWVSK